MAMLATPTIDFDALPADACVLVGYSGGLDSTVLLHLLARQLPPGRLRALHVHHGLHADADAWARHCEDTCAELGMALDVVRVQVVRDAGTGLEAAARDARHAAFADALREGEVLALAHHRDDQAETFLLRALRASGVDGLAAMRGWRPYAEGFLWRPLLVQPRALLLEWARQQGLRWIEDASNADTDLDRNFLRQRVLPLLRERWPHVDAMFARSAALAAETVELLDAEDARALEALRGAEPATLSVPGLLSLPAPWRARVLRRWIARCGLPPLPAQGVARIECDLLHAAPDAGANFAWAGACVRRWRGLLHADVAAPSLPHEWEVTWNGAAPLPLPDGATLSLHGAAAFEQPLRVRARRGGERIVLPGRSHSHALKHVLQDRGVPPWQRTRLPLLVDAEGCVLAAGDLVLAADFAEWLQAHGARLQWWRGPRSD
jgi:tRNA(Ile)-lysidine synthase